MYMSSNIYVKYRYNIEILVGIVQNWNCIHVWFVDNLLQDCSTCYKLFQQIIYYIICYRPAIEHLVNKLRVAST